MAKTLETLALPSEQRVNILLVDDQPANLLALRAILQDLGHDLVEAQSADEARTLLGTTDFAVVLLDIQMNDLDGFSTAKLIRSQERSCYTPIIFHTAPESNRLPSEESDGPGRAGGLSQHGGPIPDRLDVDWSPRPSRPKVRRKRK